MAPASARELRARWAGAGNLLRRSVGQGAEGVGLALAVVEAALAGDRGAGLRHGRHDVGAARSGVASRAGHLTAGEDPADLTALDRVGQPVDAHLALPAGEAADSGNVGARLDDGGRR